MSLIDFEIDDFKGAAYAFTPESFDKYADGTIRNADDAARAVMAERVAEPGLEVVEKACRRMPLLPQRVCDVLCEAAGFAGDEATVEEALTADTPPGVLKLAGMSTEEAERVCRECPDDRLRIVIVRDRHRHTLFACVIRPDEEAIRLLRGERKKGYARLCRSAALASIVWSGEKPEEAFAQWPAIPALILAPRILELGGSGATRRFRVRS